LTGASREIISSPGILLRKNSGESVVGILKQANKKRISRGELQPKQILPLCVKRNDYKQLSFYFTSVSLLCKSQFVIRLLFSIQEL